MRLSHLLFCLALLACKPHGEAPGNKPYPEASADVAALRDGGVVWTNAEVRAFYVRRVSAIGPAAEQSKREGLPPLERARRAYQMRKDARLLSRAMMREPADVDALRARDQAKYGSPDGPTFEWLVAHEQQKGLSDHAVYEAIIESAQRTDRAVDEALGL
jgi:hypothetical protein